ncbi:TGS domain-containing protein [Candidatus Woesearchaeota archaeon]|nr:TGS domain-containing protein [Candidatus Woesearchaeota archaeon]
MATNPGYEYANALKKYHEAKTVNEKLKALHEMLQTAPKHKSAENLLADIKAKIAKYKKMVEKEASQKRGKTKFSIKKEGSATICIVGTTNSGKSTLLKDLTNAKPEIAPYPFTTKKPEVGTLDYNGIKLQVIEIPPIVKNFRDTKNGLAFLSIIRMSDLVILMFNNDKEKKLLEDELYDIDIPILTYTNQSNLNDKIWNKLGLIKVYTKQPGKEKDYPPVALKKGSIVRELAEHVHKDFVKKFKFARVWGKSVKFNSQRVGMDHIMQDNDIVELHIK